MAAADHTADAEPSARAGHFRAVALDLDGTLTLHGPPGPDVLAEVDCARMRGLAVVLVTGRILSELRAFAPGLETHFDRVVAENGAVIADGYGRRLLADPLPESLFTSLQDVGLCVRRGEILVACSAHDAGEAMQVILDLGLEVQLVQNRNELMALPSGVSKGSGLAAALADLDLTPHDVVAVGDAENDHSLLDAAEYAVAVANAVDSLKSYADLVTDGPDGAGVAQVLRRVQLSGALHSRRRTLRLGVDNSGRPVAIPASQTSLLIQGRSCSGKSYAVGLVTEQLVEQGYGVLVLDMEGDHVGLGQMGALVFQTGQRLRPVDLLDRPGHPGAVVFDLSQMGFEQRRATAVELLKTAQSKRLTTGHPHWVVVDEAQDVPADVWPAFIKDHHGWGLCLATYRPEDMPPHLMDAIDWRLVTDREPMFARLSGRDVSDRELRLEVRATPHLRHLHKYVTGSVPLAEWFYFRDDSGLQGSTAQNLHELVDVTSSCDERVVLHHARHRDLSGWVREILKDESLASEISALEEDVDGIGGVDALRQGLRQAVSHRYGPINGS
jgi:hydroxymethylpyrimidine pyrophosphatase-like HAD family hydrolase